jgi:hypothetical protein
MRTPTEPTDRSLPPLGAPVRQQAPAPAPVPTGTPGINRQPDGKLETQIPLPSQPRIYFVADCFMGCIGGPNGPIEIHEDRWFFEGGCEQGYDSEEEAEEARDEYLGGAR